MNHMHIAQHHVVLVRDSAGNLIHTHEVICYDNAPPLTEEALQAAAAHPHSKAKASWLLERRHATSWSGYEPSDAVAPRLARRSGDAAPGLGHLDRLQALQRARPGLAMVGSRIIEPHTKLAWLPEYLAKQSDRLTRLQNAPGSANDAAGPCAEHLRS